MLIKINVTRPIAVPSLVTGQRTTDLTVGVNEVDDSILDHWFVKACLARGVVSLVGKKEVNFKTLDQLQAEKDIIKQSVRVSSGERFPIGTVTINELPPKGGDKIVLKTGDEKPPAAEAAAEVAEVQPTRRRRQ